MTAADHARHARDLRRASRDPHLNAAEAAALWAESEIAQKLATAGNIEKPDNKNFDGPVDW